MQENPFKPIYRACNSGTNEEKYQILKNAELTLPRYIDVELTNSCNFSCRFCPTGTKASKRVKGFASQEVLDAICASVSKYNIKAVRFIGWGEPLLHPECLSTIERVKKCGALTHMTTNGSLLTEDKARKLLEIGLDSIIFSFQGTDTKNYNEMRVGGDYNRLLNTIRTFHSLRNELGGGVNHLFKYQTL